MRWKPSIVMNKKENLSEQLEIKTLNIKQNNNEIRYSFGAADPFIYNGYLFCELMDNNKRTQKAGIIGCSPLKDKLNFKVIINEKFHLSYPHIFEYGEKIYMIPESCSIKKLLLYECKEFPYKWKKINVLKNNFSCYDSTVFQLNKKLYLFTTEKNNKETYLFQIRKLSKIKLELEKKNILPLAYRGGGNTFRIKNELFIPIQPSEVRFYGQKLYIYKIVRKKNKEIFFEFAYDIKMPSSCKGIHHLSNYNDKFICDNR